MSSSTIIGIPTDDKVFESNCVHLFAGILKDPNVKLYGTRGKKQSGLDLIGKRDRDPNQPVGIQCKLITRGAKLHEAVVRKEVAQALTIDPPLTEFYIATTATDEPALDRLAIKLSQEQAKAGRIVDIQVWGWDTLQDKIRSDPRALAAFDPDYSASSTKLIALGHETVEGQAKIVDQNEQILQTVIAIHASVSAEPVDTARSAFEQHLDAQVDQYRDLMNLGKPRTALDLLTTLDGTLGQASSAAIRARVKANMAHAYLRLDNEARGAELLADAYALNPTDPKVRANYILALALKGDLDGAWQFAVQTLRDDPSNVAAAGLAFQVASMSGEALDPLRFIPLDLLGELNVSIHYISYLRGKGAVGSWWTLAAETLARFPEDGAAIRMAGDALIEEALSDQTLERRSLLAEGRRSKLLAGATLLQGYWEKVRLYENAKDANWIMVAYNLITAYRALGDLDAAKTVVGQMLALDSEDGDSFLSAAWVAIDQDAFAEAAALLRRAPASVAVTLPLMVALSNQSDFAGVLTEATTERRDALPVSERQLFDTLVFRAKHAVDPEFDLKVEVEHILEAWPLGLSAHIAVADIYRVDKPEEAAGVAGKARLLISEDTSYSDRVMYAQLSLFRNAWDEIIWVLDGHVRLDRPSEELGWLALAFANAGTRPCTAPFFASLSTDIIALPRYARLAGAAEHNRGDLKAAERYLRAAIAADPSDLRAQLLLASTLSRANRQTDAVELLRQVDDAQVFGSATDLMRLAHNHRRAGEIERALRLGYRIAIHHRQDEEVMTSYPGLILLDATLPPPVGHVGPAAIDFWFDLEGLNGARDAAGVIDSEAVDGVTSYAPDHPLAAAVLGTSVGDEILIPADLGADRRYRIRQLKHKYIWLLHDIMATHAARFPEATSLVEMTMQDGDVQPVLDMVRDFQKKDDLVGETYGDYPVPLAAVAWRSHKHVLALADHLATTGKPLRTCMGSLVEREEAVDFVRRARGNGAVLDTLTVWQVRELGHLAAVKAYFGRLCIARSTFDELLELRAQIESNRGHEFMTMGYEGGQAWRRIHTAEETEARIAAINEAITDIETHCEILAVDGTNDARLDRVMGTYAAQKLFDPINLAKSQALILVSEDLNLRQLAAQYQVIGGAWLQVVLHVLGAAGAIADHDYLIAVGTLGAMRHDHLWLDAKTMVGILTIEDPRAFALFEAAITFMGGRKADMQSHLGVTLDFLRAIWTTKLPGWQQGRAAGRLMEQLTRSRPNDWKAVLHILDAELGKLAVRGDLLARRGRDYLVGWIMGHFYDLEVIRSLDKIVTELRTAQPMKTAKKSKRKRIRAG